MRTTNLFILRGRVGQAPKAFGRAAKVNVATDRFRTDAEGKRQEETDWGTVTLLNEKVAAWALAKPEHAIHQLPVGVDLRPVDDLEHVTLPDVLSGR